MQQTGIKNPNASLPDYDINNWKYAFWNLNPIELIEQTLRRSEGTLTHNGTLSIKTGKFTGRSPKDRYIVKDKKTENTVDWNEINQEISTEHYLNLKNDLIEYLNGKDLFIKDAGLCADKKHQINIRVIAEQPYSAQFVHNMFIRLSEDELLHFEPDWVIYAAPGFQTTPKDNGTRAENFSIINFTEKIILVGGSGYTGEIKKGMFSVLNYDLPKEKGILSMHCSANVGQSGDSAVFFGLSGTGKTTLSADPQRQLIGDDEHGWSEEGLFNFEGGCYAKCINLTKDSEPDIYNAIRPGAILENITFHPGSCRPNFEDASITENTRVSYPIHYISNHYKEGLADHPKNIFFLTCDAFGVLPPLSKLNISQAMYYFISGYTAKVAGTEEGVLEPKATFSACFGAPFLPLHPNSYARLLGEKLKKHKVNIWLVNTGWTGGSYGVGHRISLKYTRRLITAALSGELDKVSFANMAVFNLQIPSFCPEVPGEILHPRNSWHSKTAYNEKRIELAQLFIDNFHKYGDKVDEDILQASPEVEMALVE
ncbi:MAG: phosphoenolpyruvate carboxykinase (ATP) [Bacteroidia bacterium]|nr:phosphoenolpyruvate carboxykinase (ATP) [Bacteroidia bacterium]